MGSRPAASDDDRLDAVFGALSHRVRRAMLQRLMQGPVSVSELAAPFDMSLPAVSKHIKVLERAGLVQRAIDGRVHHCHLDAKPLEGANGWVAHYRRFWEGSLDRLARYAEQKAKGAKR